MNLRETIIIDDLFSKEEQIKYHNLIFMTNSWAFIKDMMYSKEDVIYPSYGFNMLFKHPELGVVSELYETVSVPIIESLKIKTNLQIEDIIFNRAFLQVPLDQKFRKQTNGIHVDLPTDHYACVYYLNDSDGDTIIYEQTRYNTEYGSKNVNLIEHKRVTPKQGRIVLFDGARFHCSSQPSNSYRGIINFDLLMKD